MDVARAREWCFLLLLSAVFSVGFPQWAGAQAGDFGPDEVVPDRYNGLKLSSHPSDQASSSQPGQSSTTENSAQSNSHPLFDPNSPESRAEEQANRQSERDNLFVKYLLISCAAAGVIIAFVVWRSMPPKPKANT